VIGSSDETKTRSNVNWKEGCAYFVAANGGKALGWIHTNIDASFSGQPIGHAIIYNIKIPLSDAKIHSVGAGDEGVVDEKWVKEIFQMFANVIGPNPQTGNQGERHATGTPVTDEISLSGIEMSAEHSAAIAKIITNLES
jgi:hypothetical protein